MNSDFRIAAGIVRAERASRPQVLPKPVSIAAKQGLRYENKVGRELRLHISAGKFSKIEHNPWFSFHDSFGASSCCPDFLIWADMGVIITEVKLTWIDVAIEKLNSLYTPVVSAALSLPTTPLVICRNITSASPPASHTITDAMRSPFRLLQWPNNGHILW